MTGASSSLGFDYGESGLRLSKTINGVEHKYLWQGSKLVSEYYDGKELEFFYDESGNPYAFSYKSGSTATPVTYYYLTNLQGDITGILDASGTTVAAYTYNAWGKLLSSTGDMASINPLRYRGYYYDAETGLYYVSSRYYDPEIGRFINPDDVDLLGANGDFASLNLFAYCGNNPVSRADVAGEFWHIVAGAVGGALVGGIAQVASNLITGHSWSDGIGSAMLTGAAGGALAASGVGLIGSIAGNAGIAMMGNAAKQVVKNRGFNDFNAYDMLIDGAIGAFSGFVGGKGASRGNVKSAMALGRQLTKRIANTGEIGRAISYYAKNMMTEGGKSIYKELNKSLIKGGTTTLVGITLKDLFV